MTRELRFQALIGLSKSASAVAINNVGITQEYLQGFRKAAEDLGIDTSVLSENNISLEYLQGFCKTAEDAGVDPVELMKMAGLWDSIKGAGKKLIKATTGAVGGAIGTVGGGLKGLVWDSWHPDSEGKTSWYGRIGNGFAEGAKSGWNAGWEVPGVIYNEGGDIAKNFGYGAANMALGFGKGVANIPGFLAGLGGSSIGLTKGLLWDSWHPNGDEDSTWYGRIWDSTKGGYNTGSDLVNKIGPGNYDLEHLNGYLNKLQNTNANNYMANNSMDPRNMSWADRAALFGFNVAGTSGELLGDAVAFGAAGKGLKAAGRGIMGVAKGGKNVATPVATVARNARRGATVARNAGRWQKIKTGLRTAGKYGYGAGVNGLMAYGRTVEDINNKGHAMGNGGNGGGYFDPYGTTNTSGLMYS